MKAIFLAGLILAGGVPTLAAADTYMETTCGVSQRWSGGVVCDQGVTYSFTSDGTATIMGLYLTAPVTHCSRVKYIVALPPPPPPTEPAVIAVPATPLEPAEWGNGYLTQTGPLRPGETELVTLGRGFAAGRHEVMIMVYGLEEDCNVGQIHSWGVSAAHVIIPE